MRLGLEWDEPYEPEAAALNPQRPAPNRPPNSYRVDGESAFFYRRVSPAELASVRALQHLSPPPGGIALGKHLTTTPALARKWGELMVSCGWEATAGHILEVKLAAATAQAVHYLGPTDGIGACYFATFDELFGAIITEVT
jgi:hypothetical protein